jgi:hypothetical protein
VGLERENRSRVLLEQTRTSTEITMTEKRRRPAKRREKDLQHDDRGAGHAPQRSKKDLDEELDKALQDSFPSSDPPATSQPTDTEPAGDPNVKP